MKQFVITTLAVLLLAGGSARAQALIEATNETLIFDSAGRNVGKLIGLDRVRFRKPDGTSIFATLVMRAGTWDTGDVGYATLDCTGQAYVTPQGNGSTGIDVNNVLYSMEDNLTALVLMSALTANGCEIYTQGPTPFSFPFPLMNPYVDLDDYFTPPFSYGGPPRPVTPSFTDVPASSPFFQSIELMKAAGITAGCGGGQYCPQSPVTREQMAAFMAQVLGVRFIEP
jgi:hypothetical protein